MNTQAIVVKEFGGAQVLEFKDVFINPPNEGQVLIRLAYIGVNFVDVYQRSGYDPQPLPFTPGLEGSGIVEKIGKGVTHVKAGDRVAFSRQPGAYARHALIPEASLIPLPADVSLEQGAALLLQGMTAHYLIHEFRKPVRGDVVLIHGAAGGMSLLLVQWAKHLGARVIGTVSTRQKAEAALSAGAGDVIFYTEKDFAVETKKLTAGHGADLIIDGVGKTTFKGNLEAAALRGHIIIYGAASGAAGPISPNALMAASLSLSGGDLQHFLLSREELMQRAGAVIKGLEQGWLQLEIYEILPLNEAAKAHRIIADRQHIGKILLSAL